MEREITKELIKWKSSPNRMPLILTGIRQCGKTYAMTEFGKNEFEDYAYFNFEKSESLKEIFGYDLDPKRIIEELSLFHGRSIVPGKTLLILDEVQTCVRAITSLKYFCESVPELHIIAAGSLLGVTLKNETLSFPVGKVQRLQMYPMNFKEFLNAHNPKLIQLFEKRYELGSEINEQFVRPLEYAFKLYFIIGGMPKAVDTWIQTNDLQLVEEIQTNILQDYQNDFSKHAPKSDIPKLSLIWDSIPLQLAKENNKFMFGHVKTGARSKDLEDALTWLEQAGLTHKCKLVEHPNLPLSHSASSTSFKLYMADVGLLRRKSGLSARTIIEETEKYVEFKGALTENFVMQELLTQNKQPYFWRSNNQAELDFLFEEDNQVIPVEVKAAINTTAKSYDIFCKRYNPQFGFKFSLKNVGEHETGKTVTYSVPLYLMWKMQDYIDKELNHESDFDIKSFAKTVMDLDSIIENAERSKRQPLPSKKKDEHFR